MLSLGGEMDLKYKYILKHQNGMYVSEIKKGTHYYDEDINNAYVWGSYELADKIRIMLEDGNDLKVIKVSVNFQEVMDDYSSGGTNCMIS